MKKSIFILAALFAATFANAQITYEGLFKGLLTVAGDPYTQDFLGEEQHPQPFEAPYIIGINNNEDSIYLYNKEDFSIYKTIKIQEGRIGRMFAVRKGIYTSDPDKVGFVVYLYQNGSWRYLIMDEDGNELYQLTQVNSIYRTEVVKIGEGYKLFVSPKGTGTFIYSLPGKGEATDLSEVSTPRRNNARRYINNDQVLIDSNERTYTIQGQEVK